MRRYSGALLRVEGQDRLLLEVRQAGDSSAGLWGLIGGGMEDADADSLDTMRREWREETGRDPDEAGFEHLCDMQLVGSKGDTLAYSVFEGTVAADAKLILSEAAGVVAVDVDELRAGIHDGQLTLVARTVLSQILGEQQ